MRPASKVQHPELKAPDITRLLSSQWKALSKEEKQPFEKASSLDKARFQKEKEAFAVILASEVM